MELRCEPPMPPRSEERDEQFQNLVSIASSSLTARGWRFGRDGGRYSHCASLQEGSEPKRESATKISCSVPKREGMNSEKAAPGKAARKNEPVGLLRRASRAVGTRNYNREIPVSAYRPNRSPPRFRPAAKCTLTAGQDLALTSLDGFARISLFSVAKESEELLIKDWNEEISHWRPAGAGNLAEQLW
jgi:hypothetical protein